MDSYRSIKLLFITFFTLFLVILKLLFFLLTNAAVHMTFSKKHSRGKRKKAFYDLLPKDMGRKQFVFHGFSPSTAAEESKLPLPYIRIWKGLM